MGQEAGLNAYFREPEGTGFYSVLQTLDVFPEVAAKFLARQKIVNNMMFREPDEATERSSVGLDFFESRLEEFMKDPNFVEGFDGEVYNPYKGMEDVLGLLAVANSITDRRNNGQDLHDPWLDKMKETRGLGTKSEDEITDIDRRGSILVMKLFEILNY